MLRVLLVIDDYNELSYLRTLLKKLGFDVDGLQSHSKVEESLLTLNPQVIVTTAKGKRVNGYQVIKSVIQRDRPPKIVLLEDPNHQLTEEERDIPQISEVLSSPVNPKKLLQALAQLGNLDEESLLTKFIKVQAQAAGEDDDVLIMFKSEIEELRETIEPSKPKDLSRTEAQERPQGDSENGAKVAQDLQETASDDATSDVGDAVNESPGTKFNITPSTMTSEKRQELFSQMLAELDETDEVGSGKEPVESSAEAVLSEGEVDTRKVFDVKTVRQFNKEIRAQENVTELQDLEEERREFVRALMKNKTKD